MAITSFEACKKRKRTSAIFTVEDLAAALVLRGSFRENIRLFLSECAELQDFTVGGGNLVWSTLLLNESNGVVFPLYTVEEQTSSSSQPFCHFCRCVGWSHHFISKRSYHIIIPKDGKWTKPLNKASLGVQTHLLHAIIHCNGFGHLVSINGAQSKSRFIRGNFIMTQFDHLCSILRPREISVMDSSQKNSMLLRLLHGVAYGRPWFGKWGYKFHHGSFGVTWQKYDRAIQILTSLQLSSVVNGESALSNRGRLIERIVRFYSAASETQLDTVSDLLQFMLSFKSTAPIQRKLALLLASISSSLPTHQEKPQPIQHQPSLSGNSFAGDNTVDAAFLAKLQGSRYPARRLENTVREIVYILEERGAPVTRQDLRDTVRKKIGDTGLIDCVLKNMDKVRVGDQVIHRSNNPANKVLEFELQGADREENPASVTESVLENIVVQQQPQQQQPGLNVYQDVLVLYKVLLGYKHTHAVNEAARTVLDSNHFIKKWEYKSNPNDKDVQLNLHCGVRPKYQELVQHLTRPWPPLELVVVPQHITVGEFKQKVQCALRDTYCVMEEFVVRDVSSIGGELKLLRGSKGEEEEEMMECGAEEGMEVWVGGCGLDLNTKLRYQGGDDNWRVDCRCGANDDDGERMVACDGCHLWQHTRCNGISDGDEVSCVFLCWKCKSGSRK